MSELLITDLDDLGIIAHTHGTSHADRKADCESQVTLWRWASNVMYDPRPFGAILMGGPGEWLTQKSGAMPYEYGFGPQGEVLVERIYMTEHHYREQFVFHSPGRIVSFSYPHVGKHLDWVCVTRFSDGRPLTHSRYSPHHVVGRLEEHYHYQGGLIRRRECREVRCGIPVHYAQEFLYDDQGELVRIETDNAARGVVYEKEQTEPGRLADGDRGPGSGSHCNGLIPPSDKG